MVAATATQMAGQLQSGIYANQMSRYAAQTAQANKALTREGALDAIDRGQGAQQRLGREVAQRVGQQTARIAANNVDISTGSAARTIEDTRMIGREDSDILAENMRREVRGFQIDAWSFESGRRAHLAEGKQAIAAAIFGAATTALGGVTQYAKFNKDRAPA